MIDTDHSSDSTNYQVDLPEGGNDTVSGNVMFKSAYPENRAFIHFGGEIPNPTGSLVVQNNQIYSEDAPSVLLLNQSKGQSIHITNNAIETSTVSITVDGDTSNASIGANTVLDTLNLPSTAIALPNTSGGASFAASLAPSFTPSQLAEMALIDTSFYLSHNADVAAAGLNAVQHFETFGWHEGRAPNALFDVNYYLSHNPDVAASGMDPLLHYATMGWKEGRDPSAAFSTSGYLAANPDVKLAGVDPLQQYLAFGTAEGRAV
jgi:hypothetical protein